MNKIKLLFLFLALLCSFPQSVIADGGFYRPIYSTNLEDPSMPSQQAIIIYDEGVETLIVSSEYSGEPEEFAWVLPLPSVPSDIDVASDNIFSGIRELTQPEIIISYGSKLYSGVHGGFGCGCSASESDINDKSVEVTIISQLHIGYYEITTVSSESSDALLEWFDTNEFYWPDTTEANTVLEDLCAENWVFVCTKIVPESDSYVSGKTMPLQVIFNADKIIYPMRMTALSNTDEIEITLYIFAESRVDCVEIPTDNFNITAALKEKASNKVTYDELISDQAREGFIVEYAKYVYPTDISGVIIDKKYFLTRMTTLMKPEDMTTDFTFTVLPYNTSHNYAIDIEWWVGGVTLPKGKSVPAPDVFSAILPFALIFLFIKLLKVLNAYKKVQTKTA
ncbi:MAG: DUF2330 domain-containing protein [Planctomycetota bacterium]